jgi:hypothetical protein
MTADPARLVEAKELLDRLHQLDPELAAALPDHLMLNGRLNRRSLGIALGRRPSRMLKDLEWICEALGEVYRPPHTIPRRQRLNISARTA